MPSDARRPRVRIFIRETKIAAGYGSQRSVSLDHRHPETTDTRADVRAADMALQSHTLAVVCAIAR
jgi:hypothetical protein